MTIAFSFIAMLIIIVPVWKIFSKAGLHPALSLLLFIPAIGPIIVLLILAFADWQPARRT